MENKGIIKGHGLIAFSSEEKIVKTLLENIISKQIHLNPKLYPVFKYQKKYNYS